MDWLWTNAEKLSGIGTILAFVVAVGALLAQRTHNKLSVRPLPEIKLSDLTGEISVVLANHGTGPLIIRDFVVSRDGRYLADSLIEAMPGEIYQWDWFVPNINGRSVSAGAQIVLLRYKLIPLWGGEDMRDVRLALKNLTVHIDYSDVYNGSHPVYTKQLAWFGRFSQ